MAKKSIDRLKEKLRKITKRNRGVSLTRVIEEINKITPGWVRYFRYAKCTGTLQKLDEWLRHKLRCYKLKQLKNARTTARWLMQRGIGKAKAWCLAASGKGWWRKSLSPQAHRAMGIGWWKLSGLKSLYEIYESL